jgi:hypothetical protein
MPVRKMRKGISNEEEEENDSPIHCPKSFFPFFYPFFQSILAFKETKRTNKRILNDISWTKILHLPKLTQLFGTHKNYYFHRSEIALFKCL